MALNSPGLEFMRFSDVTVSCSLRADKVKMSFIFFLIIEAELTVGSKNIGRALAFRDLIKEVNWRWAMYLFVGCLL